MIQCWTVWRRVTAPVRRSLHPRRGIGHGAHHVHHAHHVHAGWVSKVVCFGSIAAAGLGAGAYLGGRLPSSQTETGTGENGGAEFSPGFAATLPIVTSNATPVSVPEPGSALILTVGVGAILLIRRNR